MLLGIANNRIHVMVRHSAVDRDLYPLLYLYSIYSIIHSETVTVYSMLLSIPYSSVGRINTQCTCVFHRPEVLRAYTVLY